MANTKFTAQNIDPSASTGVAALSWSPTAYKADNATTLTKTVVFGKYSESRKMVTLTGVISINDSQTPGANIFLTIPVTAINPGNTICVGSGYITHAGNSTGWPINVSLKSDGTRLQLNGSSDRNTAASFSDYTSLVIYFTANYEAS